MRLGRISACLGQKSNMCLTSCLDQPQGHWNLHSKEKVIEVNLLRPELNRGGALSLSKSLMDIVSIVDESPLLGRRFFPVRNA